MKQTPASIQLLDDKLMVNNQSVANWRDIKFKTEHSQILQTTDMTNNTAQNASFAPMFIFPINLPICSQFVSLVKV
jgi:hypothetical protein